VITVIVVAAPFVLQKTSNQSLKNLQTSQTALSHAAGTPGNNLALEQVNYSSRSAIITNLPRRIAELFLRPWPWQVSDASQRIGVVGTLIAYTALVFLLLYFIRWRSRVFALVAPLLYPLFFLTIAYALSIGNAGTGFRYRSPLVMVMIAVILLLREHWLMTVSASTMRGRRSLFPGSALGLGGTVPRGPTPLGRARTGLISKGSAT
jgi:hypothetical protein